MTIIYIIIGVLIFLVLCAMALVYVWLKKLDSDAFVILICVGIMLFVLLGIPEPTIW